MDHILNPYSKLFLVALVCISFSNCERDAVVDATPVAYILGSEQRYLPESVALPADTRYANTRVATYYASGVQQYRAKEIPGSYPIAYEWTFVAPQADLYDGTNRKVGTHGAGPLWRTLQGDSIMGQHFSPARTAPADDAASIDWLLLKPKEGTLPTGIFTDVTYIQRIATKGGKAPVAAPTRAGETVEVHYEAVYRFSKIDPK